MARSSSLQAFSSLRGSGGELGRKPSRSLGLRKDSRAHLQKATLSVQNASWKLLCDSPRRHARDGKPRGAMSRECSNQETQHILKEVRGDGAVLCAHRTGAAGGGGCVPVQCVHQLVVLSVRGTPVIAYCNLAGAGKE